MKILLVEDDEFNALLLEKALKAYNYQIEIAKDGPTGLELAKMFEYDLLLLDVMLPKMDGISLCRQLRLEGYHMPILMLTANDSTSLRVTGMEAGADDYITKPIDLSELLARMKALLRRAKVILPTILSWENLHLDTNTREVTYNGESLHLTPKEHGLLELFLRNPGRIFTRNALLDSIWLSSESPGEEAVTTQIKGLRQKLKAVGMTEDLIETLYGLGYRLRKDEKGTSRQDSKKQNKRRSLSCTEFSQKRGSAVLGVSPMSDCRRKAEAEVIVLVKKMWEEFKGSRLQEQLELFEQVLAHLSTGNLDSHLLKLAHTEAHRLAGTLGCYGFHEGSKLARQIEVLLQSLMSWEQYPLWQLERLEKLITSLQKILQQQPSQTATLATSKLSLPRLLIIDDDTILTERIKLGAAAWGLQVDVATDLTTAKSVLASYSPNVILLDLTFSNPQENGLNFLSEISQKNPKIPVIVFTASNQFRCRVEAARLGAQTFLHKTTPVDEVLSVVRKSLNQSAATHKAKIMVVDDDPIVLNHAKSLLLPLGFEVTTLQQPQHFWKELETFTPELLILDIEMPNFNGIELCQVVRTDSRWSHLPVLFLSVHSDAKIVRQVYAVGADDYLRKPIVEQELITRVLNRLERTQQKTRISVRIAD
ncbi:multi-component transcriptional regulator, winged helix family protein [Scytonema sp. HK-05]|uniref:response regulator n=1 Tax=Scytonema sp. HK-05 TaxID=1137095 RepID=UPI000935C0D7|nr:response regulator [Scytonema sp. HK-05]OKH59909.1 multi-component transcriptional regulator [Scytonema sp. HK-05]BAY43007.1 multi-component transcriptional regulator, winged helix family protein [Scytonema sp. HK-05]